MRGAKRAVPSKTNPQDSIMQFGREGKGGRFSYQELEFSSTVEPAQEMEVSIAHCSAVAANMQHTHGDP